jgi:hypothetical protein
MADTCSGAEAVIASMKTGGYTTPVQIATV